MMTRVLSLLSFVALAAVLFWLPSPPAYTLAALEAGAMLSEPVAGTEENATLWETLIASDAADVVEYEGGKKHLTLRMGGSLVKDDSGAGDPAIHGEARKSIRRAMRSLAKSEGYEFELEGARMPYKGELAAVGTTLVVQQGSLRLEVLVRLGEVTSLSTWTEKEWYPAQRYTLFPALLAILMAIVFRRPVLALLSGVVLGAVTKRYVAGDGALTSLYEGTKDVGSVYWWNEFIEPERYYIILFVVFMLAMVGVMTRAGGIRGLMTSIAKMASDSGRTQLATWIMGLAIFFDDYANTILVGSTMRPLCDRYKVSREKLAYIVDSTAAPIAGLSIFSTWIAFEVSTFSAQLPDVGIAASDGYAIFLQTLPYRFYCIFTIVFVGLVVLLKRDFGPMLTAERRARGGQLFREGATPLSGGEDQELTVADGVIPKVSTALWPLFTFIGVTVFEIMRRGNAFNMDAGQLFSLEGMTQVLFDGSGSQPLMIGAIAGFLVACVCALLVGLRSDIPIAAFKILRTMGIAIVILYLAWMIGSVSNDLGTAKYLSVLLGSWINPPLLPCVLFILAGVVAFSTGSSWSTMSIILPLVVGLSYELGQSIPEFGGHAMLVICIGAVLEGAIFGDHCSPISDTTVMSSIASGSDHIDHVRTQAPYALLTMVIAMVAGYFPCVFLGLSPYLAILFGTVLMAGILLLKGRKVDEPEAA